MITRASTRRSTRNSSSTSERTRKHKIPKNHIDNIFVKNIRQQRLKKNVLKKYFNAASLKASGQSAPLSPASFTVKPNNIIGMLLSGFCINCSKSML